MTVTSSLQLYTVRDALGSDLLGTLGKLSAMGFECVEPFMIGKYPQLVAALSDFGLKAPTAHASFMAVPDPERVFEISAKLGVETLIEPHVPVQDWSSSGGPLRIADRLNSLANRAAQFDIQLGYHNHHHELETLSHGAPALLEFAGALEPEVVLEVDTYWAATGGVDPAELLESLGNKVIAIHLKDGPATLDKSLQVALGEGALNVPAILSAAPHALRVIEFDDTAGDIFEAIGRSEKYLQLET
ncbi:sugar phosphate isomerase/epimerase family protein [Arthrobacter sp. 2RAF6]|uniref:sugar phosphate isomerase/epimerase family protein n=1 Tax=Arthrobacter sp. 2RAF6 TaxID=3233002 RepID=UPI003F8DFFA7